MLVKAAGFFTFTSALTALLPIVVNRELQASAATYGLLLGCIGVGAVGGAMLLPRLRARFDADRLVMAATLVYALCMLALALCAVCRCCVTEDERVLQEQIVALLADPDQPPRVSHYVGGEPGEPLDPVAARPEQ